MRNDDFKTREVNEAPMTMHPHRAQVHDEFDALISLIDRKPVVGWVPTFAAPQRVRRENIDPIILALRPRGSRVITTAREKDLHLWFGVDGKFPAVRLEADGTIPR